MLRNCLLFLISAFALTGCPEDEPITMPNDYVPPAGTGNIAGTPAGDEAGVPAGVEGGTAGGVEAGTPGGGEVDPCYNYETQFGQVVDCSVLTNEVRCAGGVGIEEYEFLNSACSQCYTENGNPRWTILACPEVCDDEDDNDTDGRIDCEDPDCRSDERCRPEDIIEDEPVESCMQCHNGASSGINDYSGPGITNPHPFGRAAAIKCTSCHGGNGEALGKVESHVPPHPKVGDRLYQATNPEAASHRITLAGIDKLEPAQYPGSACEGGTCSNLDYLQFINPGDLRVVAQGRGCGAGGCHAGEHAEWVPRSAIATTNGFFSGTRFMVGAENRVVTNRASTTRAFEDEGDALSGSAPRAISNPAYNQNNREIGEVGELVEQPEVAQFYNGPMLNNGNYDANALVNDIDNTDLQRPNRVRSGSNLEKLIDEQVSITCGNCHLYSAGANNRYADFRSSGCTSCHMQYSMDGRSRSTDPNVSKLEPANPDQIANGERAHISDHIIRNVSKTTGGVIVRGITDNACVGCHQGSNRTVLQYWGIRLDQNADLANNTQYPENPANFTNTANDRRLFDPAINNNTFNGRVADQYILYEDYDDDGLDDTPPDVHYESGMGCIDCHGSRDLHGGTKGDVTSGKIMSRQDQATAIACESCHGDIEGYAETAPCKDYQGQDQTCAVDRFGNVLKHVIKDPQDNFWLTSRVYGTLHYVPQTRDLTYNTNKSHPRTGNQLYSPKAAYAMGRINGTPGSGPVQTDPTLYSQGFSHTDDLDCASCHAAWTNNCIGCHLKGQYNANPADFFFSNITGERILIEEANADFVYQNPIPTYLGINSRGYITQISPAEKMFYRYEDLNGNESNVFAFSDRLGEGNNPNNQGRNAFPALAMNQMAPHSIRGRLDPTSNSEGLRYCVTCHLTDNAIAQFGNEYAEFRQLYYDNNFDALVDNGFFDLLRTHIGLNTGNHLDSPFFVHMVAGLGTSLFLFDANGCPVNPFDANDNRQNCNNEAPADIFDVNNVAYDLDRIVEFDGQTNSTSIHPRLNNRGPRRDGNNYMMAGPLNRGLLERLTDPDLGLVLDSWLDANGNEAGDANNYVQ